MIYDTIEKLSYYAVVSPVLAEAVEVVKKLLLQDDISLGRTDFSDRVYANVMEYDTKEKADCLFETHQDYADIQFMVVGQEDFGVAEPKNLEIVEKYDPEKDICLYKGVGQGVVRLSQGMFVLAFPHDAHMPCIRVGDCVHAKKVVVKVKITQE